MSIEATPAEIEAAARELGGYSAEQLERWRHTTGGQRATRDAEAALAAVLPLVEARLREQIADEIGGSMSYGCELRYDGSEDPGMAAYLDGLRDAACTARGQS